MWQDKETLSPPLPPVELCLAHSFLDFFLAFPGLLGTFPSLGTLCLREGRGSKRLCDRKGAISEEPQAVLLLPSVLAEPDLNLNLWSLG